MSTMTTTHTPVLEGTRPSFARLVRVELRKMVDTRAGLWILISIAVITAGASALPLWILPAEGLTWSALIDFASAGWALLLPFLGVLAATSEWSQRTGLSTFTLEPRRTLVNIAKLVASLILGLGMLAATFGAAAIANLVGIAAFDGDGSWSLSLGSALGYVGGMAIYVTMGVGLGLALLSTPLAIVTFIVAPVLLSVLVLVPALSDVIPWIDLSTASIPLLAGTLAGEEWARLATATALWCGVPLALGLWRTSRREVT